MSANSRRHRKANKLLLQAERKARAVASTRTSSPMLDQLEIGVLYQLRDAVETRCYCAKVLQPGTYVTVLRFTSPNRVQILHGMQLRSVPNEFGLIDDASAHKIRASSLRACAEKIAISAPR